MLRLPGRPRRPLTVQWLRLVNGRQLLLIQTVEVGRFAGVAHTG